MTFAGNQYRIARRKLMILKDRWLLPPPRRPERIAEVASAIHHCPLVMISQIQRSGGTLLSQLFDGHPQVWVFPGELHLAKPKYTWPRIKLWLPPAIIFRQLVDHRCIEYARDGYKKSKLATERMAFDYDVGLHCAAFCMACERLKPATQRHLFDIFFSTFYASWEGFRGRGETPTLFCAFAADFAIHGDSVEAFFRDYPDGHLISVIRDPATWLASAINKQTSRRRFATEDKAIEHWRQSAQALRANKSRYPEQVDIVAFNDLIESTAPVMRALCGRLGVAYASVMATPTFNRDPIESNSSFAASKGVIDKDVLQRAPRQEGQPQDEALYADLLRHRTSPAQG